MIGKLRGVIDQINNDQILLDVNNVGYLISVSSRTIQDLPKDGSIASLLINMQVKEDSMTLYGFLHDSEKEWFLKLISVKGVGPRLALAILSSLTSDQISATIYSKDISSLNRISGIGKKIAERIITELKDVNIQNLPFHTSNNTKENNENKIPNILEDAVSALANLGYNRSDSYNIATKILRNKDNATLSDLIKLSLKELS